MARGLCMCARVWMELFSANLCTLTCFAKPSHGWHRLVWCVCALSYGLSYSLLIPFLFLFHSFYSPFFIPFLLCLYPFFTHFSIRF